MKKLTKNIIVAVLAATALGIAEKAKFQDRYEAAGLYDGFEEEYDVMLLFAPDEIKRIAEDANNVLISDAKYTVFDKVRVNKYAFTACDNAHILIRIRSERTGDTEGCWYLIGEDGTLYFDEGYNSGYRDGR